MQTDKLFGVEGLVVVVTGAASGLGLAIAEILAERGAHLTLIDSDATQLESCNAIFLGKNLSVESVAADIADFDQTRSAFQKVITKHGRLDVLFANAGISAGPGPAQPEGQLAAIDRSKWARVMDVNLTGTFFTLREAAEAMKRGRSGRIIVTSSMSGIRGDRYTGYAYGAAKSAINNLVRQAALELAPFNILVNAICPGPFATNIAGGRLRHQNVIDTYERIVPLGRIAQPEEIKGLALFLASPASSYVTGAVIPIDGGVTAMLC